MAIDIKSLMGQYGVPAGDRSYWTNQFNSLGAHDFLSGSSFQNMTGQSFSGEIPAQTASVSAPTVSAPTVEAPAISSPDLTGLGQVNLQNNPYLLASMMPQQSSGVLDVLMLNALQGMTGLDPLLEGQIADEQRISEEALSRRLGMNWQQSTPGVQTQNAFQRRADEARLRQRQQSMDQLGTVAQLEQQEQSLNLQRMLGFGDLGLKQQFGEAELGLSGQQLGLQGLGLLQAGEIAGGQLGLGYAGLASQEKIAGDQLGLGYANLDWQKIFGQGQLDLGQGELDISQQKVDLAESLGVSQQELDWKIAELSAETGLTQQQILADASKSAGKASVWGNVAGLGLQGLLGGNWSKSLGSKLIGKLFPKGASALTGAGGSLGAAASTSELLAGMGLGGGGGIGAIGGGTAGTGFGAAALGPAAAMLALPALGMFLGSKRGRPPTPEEIEQNVADWEALQEQYASGDYGS